MLPRSVETVVAIFAVLAAVGHSPLMLAIAVGTENFTSGIGLTMPDDCASTMPNPYSSSVCQSWVPSAWRNGDRYAFGVGSVKLPGMAGP